MGTTGQGRSWTCWTEDDARLALADWKRGEESLADFAVRHGVSPARVARWAARLGYAPAEGRRRTGTRSGEESLPKARTAGANARPGFVAITVGGDVAPADSRADESVAIVVKGIRVELGASASAERIVDVAMRLARAAAC